MPWKNGGGETIEIAVEPPGASLESFEWRVSLAQVASDGPFSRFTGIDRTLAVVDGRGMVLTIEGADHLLTTTTPPLAFTGEAATSARLVAGPIMDLNAMTRRGRWSHTVTRLEQATPATVGAPGHITLVVARSALTVRTADRVESLGLDDAVLAERVTLSPSADTQMRAYVIALWSAAGAA